MPIIELCDECHARAGTCNCYDWNCDKCDNEGIQSVGQFCDCKVGLAEKLMGVSTEADELLEEG